VSYESGLTPVEIATKIIAEYEGTIAEIGDNPCDSDETKFLFDVHRLAKAYVAVLPALAASHQQRDAAEARVKELEAALAGVMPWVGEAATGPAWATPEAKARNKAGCDAAFKRAAAMFPENYGWDGKRDG
jgi:hypothetical protein